MRGSYGMPAESNPKSTLVEVGEVGITGGFVVVETGVAVAIGATAPIAAGVIAGGGGCGTGKFTTLLAGASPSSSPPFGYGSLPLPTIDAGGGGGTLNAPAAAKVLGAGGTFTATGATLV